MGGTTGPPSSRDSHAGAGWRCHQTGTYTRLLPQGAVALSWLSPGPLIKSRNDRLAKWFGDPPNDDRRAWVAAQLAAGADPHLTIHDFAGRSRVAFLLLGDTGEGDASQYAVVPPLLQQAPGTDFMIIMGDVVYPAGDASDYEDKFYRPYNGYHGPIYGVPGNHDWYDDLHGFMRHFCDNHGLPVKKRTSGWSEVLRRLLWRAPQKTDEAAVARMQALRARPEQRAHQPGPYMAIDTGPLLVVAIDTGITGVIDQDQGDWLRSISSKSSKPKLLVTGKPLYVDGVRHPGVIENGRSTVDDIVRAPRHNYLAAIGGDVHNYQRYPVEMGDGRTIQYIVNGGGGAGTQGTHKIPRVDLLGVDESGFRCYPRRADSLSIFSQMYERRFGRLLGQLFIPPDQAAGLLEERLRITPTRSCDRNVSISNEARRAFSIVAPRKERLPGPLHEYFVQFMDYNHPPMFKSFLRIDASSDEVLIRCFAATGCREQEKDAPVEDAVRALRRPDGSWQWVTEVV
jgi:calcineurin-like phosphoesterase family protein